MSSSQRPVSHLTLVDGSGFIFRAFHGLPMMNRPDGVPVNAVYGFCNMLMRLMEDAADQHLLVVFDAGRVTFRNAIYSEYKANRPPLPEELIPQFSLIREAAKAFNVPCVEREGFEADDLIASYVREAREKGARVTIVSSDKDLMQLVCPSVEMFDPLKNRKIREQEVFDKFEVVPGKVVDVQALAGDPSDNVPGVPGIGIKTAAQLIWEYGDLDNLLAHAGDIKQPKRREALLAHGDSARISRELVRLKNDISDLLPIENFILTPPDTIILGDFLDKQNFRSIKAKLSGSIFGVKNHPYSSSSKERDSLQQMILPLEDEDREDFLSEYELITDLHTLEKWIALAQEKSAVAFSVETDVANSQKASLVGFSLAVTPGQGCYVPLLHAGLLGMSSLIPQTAALDLLRTLLEDPSILKIGHNIKFDMMVIDRHKISIFPFDDNMLLSYVQDCGAHGHGMDELAELHLGYRMPMLDEICGSGKNRITFDQLPLDKACNYAARRADISLRLHQFLKPRFLTTSISNVYETMELPLVPVLAMMEGYGIKVNQAELQNISAEFGHRMMDLEKESHHLAGQSFNLASSKQLGEILFEKLNLFNVKGKKSGKTGVLSTDAEVLEELALQHPLPACILEWRQLAKLKSTYSDTLSEQINPRTGRVHTCYSMAVTSTGRLSSSEPNLQNIPIRTENGRRIRRAFIAEPGHFLLSADYSQIELRLIAHVANIVGFKTAFQDGLDIHAITASQVFGVPLEEMDKETRQRAKAINFGIIYGISAFGLAKQLGISNGEAKNYIEAYFTKYPEIKDYMENTKNHAHAHGYVTTLFGRRCVINGINDKKPALRNFAERAAINAPIQGGAADIIKRAMILLPPALKEKNLAAKMLLQVHDELIFEVPENEIEATKVCVKLVMENVVKLDVPLLVEMGAARNWADAH